jgi:hypothetical protein
MELFLVLAALIGLAVASQLWGVDSRPGFAGARVGRVERWFPHSRSN